jgi:type 1 glutamine amidotransferase
MRTAKLGALTLTVTTGAALAQGQPPIKALIVTGHNNHNWQYTSRVHADTLAWTGRFAVDITDDPATTLADAKGIAKYQVFVLDYNDSQAPKRWGDAAEKNFVAAVSGGTGVVVIHSANNAFPGWVEYEKMVGLLWREGTGHGAFHEFDVKILDKTHPITAGMADMKSHADELYHKLVNTQGAKYLLLAAAFSATDKGGTGQDEPMALTLEYGKGRIFHTPLGHVWTGAQNQKASISDPQFKTLLCRGAEWAATGKVTLPAAWGDWGDSVNHNVLTPEEKAAGWEMLFDGKAGGAKFRGFKKDKLPAAWTVEKGTLHFVPPAEGANVERGDIVTLDEYGDFEFAVSWKVAPGGNSGIMYRSTEDHNYPWETGPEMQILDNERHNDGKSPLTSAGALYALKACAYDVARPAGEWNHARVKVVGTKIEHWLNGFLVVEIDLAGEEYKKLHAGSKFTQMPDFGTRSKGHIALQDHGDNVWFRDIKVRRLERR